MGLCEFIRKLKISLFLSSVVRFAYHAELALTEETGRKPQSPPWVARNSSAFGAVLLILDQPYLRGTAARAVVVCRTTDRGLTNVLHTAGKTPTNGHEQGTHSGQRRRGAPGEERPFYFRGGGRYGRRGGGREGPQGSCEEESPQAKVPCKKSTPPPGASLGATARANRALVHTHQ